MSLSRYSQFDEVEDARLLNLMVQERQISIKERAKVFKNHITDIIIYAGVNALIALCFFCGHYIKSFYNERQQAKDEQCIILVQCAQEIAIFHTVCAIVYLILPIFTYLAANKDDHKYFNFMKQFNLIMSLICFTIFAVLIGHSLSCIIKDEPCGMLRIIFITYITTGVCFIIAIIALVLIGWIQNSSNKDTDQTKLETQPINKIRNQLKYASQ